MAMALSPSRSWARTASRRRRTSGSTRTGTVGPIRIAAAGLGVDDGFTSYKAFVGDPPRTRWGDYGAAVTVGNDIWLASEYIAARLHACSNGSRGAIGSCGGTRTALANWATRITKLQS